MAPVPFAPRICIFLGIFIAVSLGLLAACKGESLSDKSSSRSSVVSVEPGDVTLHVAWNPHPDQTVTGYLVYYGPALDATTMVVSDLSVNSGFNMQNPSVEYKAWMDFRLRAGDDICFRIKAYNSDVESGLSAGVCARI